MRPRLGVVADDITGAGDIGSLLASQGYAVRVISLNTKPERAVFYELDGVRTDALVIDIDSRFDPPEVARAKAEAATEFLWNFRVDHFYKKTCSVLRGNVGPEIEAMMDGIDATVAVTVAAFPRNGRITLGGVHYVHGRPLAESEFARDPVHPRTESDLVADLARRTALRVELMPIASVRGGDLVDRLVALRGRGGGIALCDCETQEDLAAIARAFVRFYESFPDRPGKPEPAPAIVAGSSALAEELARMWGRRAPFDPLEGITLAPGDGVLVIAGSVMPQTAAQVAALEAAGVVVHTLDSAALLADPDGVARAAAGVAAAELAAGRDVVVRADATPDAVAAARALGAARGLSGVEVSRAVSGALAAAAAHALAASPAAGLVVLGGDTSAAVCDRLAIFETVIVEEIQAGLPLSFAPQRRLLVVLKSGSFGSPDFVLRAIDRVLTRAGRPPRSDRTASGG